MALQFPGGASFQVNFVPQNADYDMSSVASELTSSQLIDLAAGARSSVADPFTVLLVNIIKYLYFMVRKERKGAEGQSGLPSGYIEVSEGDKNM